MRTGGWLDEPRSTIVRNLRIDRAGLAGREAAGRKRS